MRLIAWNVNHRTLGKPVPQDLPRALLALAPDLVVLTEYVQAGSHSDLCASLAEGGLAHVAVTQRLAGCNQVLLASRWPTVVGQSLPPVPDHHATTNLLRVELPALGLEVVGVRAPAYERASERREYWSALSTWLGEPAARRAIVLGDFNVSPARMTASASPLTGLTARGWRLAEPTGAWSYWSPRGSSQIDHALASPGVSFCEARYVVTEAGHVFAGPGAAPMSDHAPLVVDIALD